MAVVLRLSEAGQRRLQRDGRKALLGEFRAALRGRIDPLAIPRRWRLVEQLPVNSQGKLPLANLEALFGEVDDRWPQLLGREVIDGKLYLRCRIPPELEYFDGHMEGQPILPGITQLHWAEGFARRWLALEGRFECLEGVKFQKVILPRYEVEIILDFDPDNGKLSFIFQSARGVHSRGRICFRS